MAAAQAYAVCSRHVGRWMDFRTPWGRHRGIIRRVSPHGVLVSVPRHYAPRFAFAQAWASAPVSGGDVKQLHQIRHALARPVDTYLNAEPVGWVAPGYGWWYGGWWWWWIAWAWLLAFALLLW
ncbi:hypothetical protein CVV65_08315 [Kyrpidia spormannii]|uniref:Uncharacterized protein n=1 Tax=Kyrpidia spormannii TaxID=2055160 RepID=A0A2K8N760_9BACL|nr:hypothetical protein [Kyrpidia spormannii]ATY84925.1 hypothetical protein CVV65_08315 [Kyrpidia spormannii]